MDYYLHNEHGTHKIGLGLAGSIITAEAAGCCDAEDQAAEWKRELLLEGLVNLPDGSTLERKEA